MSADFFDALETRSADEREAALMAALPKQVAFAKKMAPAYTRLLDGIDPATVTSRGALAKLPVTRKSDLIALQAEDYPFAGLNASPLPNLLRVFQSPGPIYDPEGGGANWWRIARALFAAGFRTGELLHNCFSYHFTPAGAMFESAAHALGCPVFPAGVGNTELQARAISDLKPAGYAGTPSFLKIILEKADEMGLNHRSLVKASVSGEALPPALRQALKDLGVDTAQSYITADLGLIAYESPAREGLILDEGVIVEIVRPGTGDPVPDGEVGEVVVTTFNKDYPLLRFATGDLSAILAGNSPCGRTNRRIKGWMGRADQTTKVKGMFVHPAQIAEVQRRHSAVLKARLVVERDEVNDVLTLICETASPDDILATAIRADFQAVCKLRGEVRLVAPSILPNDGKVIEDKRP